MEFINLALMGISLGIIAVSIYHYGRHSVKNTTVPATVFEKNVRMEWIFLGVVLLVAFIIRVWSFGIMPYGMNQDGAMAAIDAKALADHATDRLGMYMPVHFTAWGYGQMSVLLSYCMVPFIKVFGLNPVTARLPMLIVSMLALYILYRFVKELTGVTGAQIALVLAAFTPWHFIQSRWALDCNMFPHMMLFGVYFLYKGIKYKKRYLYISMIFFALCMYSYGVSFYTVPVFLLASCIYLLVKKSIRIRDLLICIGVYFLLSWPIYLTMMINALGWETIETPFFTIPYFPDSIRSGDILFFSDEPLKQLGENLKSLWRIFMQRDDLPWNTVPGFGTIYYCFMPFMFLGIFAAVRRFLGNRKKATAAVTASRTGVTVDNNDSGESVKRTGFWLVLCWLGTAVLCGILTQTVNVNRENILMYCLILFAAFGIYFVYEHRRYLVGVIAAMLLVMYIPFTTSYYSQAYTDSMSDIFMGGFGECLQEIEEAGCNMYYIDTRCHSTGSVEVLELQTLFYLQIDAEYYRSEAFKETYRYMSFEGVELAPTPGAGYVLPADEEYRIDDKLFKIKKHGKYIAAIVK